MTLKMSNDINSNFNDPNATNKNKQSKMPKTKIEFKKKVSNFLNKFQQNQIATTQIISNIKVFIKCIVMISS